MLARSGAAIAALLLAACASVPQATPERDAEARQYVTHPKTATLYLYRPDASADHMTEAVLHVDNRIIGAALAGAFFRLDLRPGRHRLHGSGLDTGVLNVE